MGNTSNLSVLESLPLFSSLTPEDIESISPKTREVKFASGEVLIQEGDEGDSAYIITKGLVRVYRITQDGDEVNVALLGPGEVVGEMSLLDNQPRSAFVQATEDTIVLVLYRRDFLEILEKNPKTAINLLRTLTKRVRVLDEYLEDLLSKNLIERTWKILKIISSYSKNKEINLSQEEIATTVGATRARVNEALNKLEREGKIRVSHKKVQIL